MVDTITISEATAEAFDRIGLGDFQKVETPERMAWIVLILKLLPDRVQWFPKGKWATIQSIELQLIEAATAIATELAAKETGP